MSHVLILESTPDFTAQLREVIAAQGAVQVTVVHDGQEAQSALMHHPQALTFIPLAEAENIVRSLQAIQPKLPIVVMLPEEGGRLPMALARQLAGTLSLANLSARLPFLLRRHVRDGLWDTAVLLNVLQQAAVGQLVKTVLFSRGKNHLAHWGELNTAQAIAVARQTGAGWEVADYPTRLQFMYVPNRSTDFLLYTVRVPAPQDEIYLLTLIAAPETPLSRLRRGTGRLAPALAAMLRGEPPVVAAADDDGAETAVGAAYASYALVWRPVRPLPPTVRKPLQQAIKRLAETNECTIRHLAIQPELVHLVVECPPQRDTAWAAYLFKNGSEEIIQKQFEVAANLWRTGYYATESTEPLTEAELSIFFGQDKTVA